MWSCSGTGNKILSCFIITLQLFSLVVEIQGRRYGPSIEYLTRKSPLESDNDGASLSRAKGKTLYLQDYPWKSILIPLANGKPTTDPKTAYRLFHHFHFAHFNVEAPQGFRIMAVIQTFRLATNSVSLSGCLDHIQFTDTKSGRKTSNICGEVNKNDDDFAPAGLIGPRYFSSDSEEITVEVLIVSSAIRSHGTDGSTLKRFNMKGLTVEIAFTAFRYETDCSAIVDVSSTPNPSPTHANRSDHPKPKTLMKACSSDDAISSSSSPDEIPECIPSRLFCDGVLQCGASTDLEFGFDEQNCSEIEEEDAASYDVVESNIQYEVRFRKRLEEQMTGGTDLWLIHYAVLGLAGVVTAILVFSCLCYWGIWLFPSDKKNKNDEEADNSSHSGVDWGCASEGNTLGIENLEMEMDDVSQCELDLNPHRLRSKSLAPSKLKLNPDGSHSFVSYHGNRRLTISVS